MDQQRKDKDAENESPESRAFESALKQILSVPKKEIERREAEERQKKGRTQK